MQTLSRVLKRTEPPVRSNRESKDEEEIEERKALRTSVQNLEREKLFNEFRVKDVQKDVQARDALLKEKEKELERFMPIYNDNVALRQRVKELEEKLIQAVRDKHATETRLEKQADALASVHQKRISDARTASMNVINDCVLKLRALFFNRNNMTEEEVIAEFVCVTDMIRTTVGINLC
jgi:hypothetical protein